MAVVALIAIMSPLIVATLWLIKRPVESGTDD